MKRAAILAGVQLAEVRNGKVRPKWRAILSVGLVHFTVLLLAVAAMDLVLGNGIRFSGVLVAMPLIATAILMEERTQPNIDHCKRVLAGFPQGK